jgi:hypothetical protein
VIEPQFPDGSTRGPESLRFHWKSGDWYEHDIHACYWRQKTSLPTSWTARLWRWKHYAATKRQASRYLIDIPTTLPVGRFGGSNPGRGKKFVSSSKRPDRLWGPRNLVFKGYRRSSPNVKRPESKANHLLPNSAEVSNGCRYTYASLFSFKTWTEESFTSFYLRNIGDCKSTRRKNPNTFYLLFVRTTDSV